MINLRNNDYKTMDFYLFQEILFRFESLEEEANPRSSSKAVEQLI